MIYDTPLHSFNVVVCLTTMCNTCYITNVVYTFNVVLRISRLNNLIFIKLLQSDILYILYHPVVGPGRPGLRQRLLTFIIDIDY